MFEYYAAVTRQDHSGAPKGGWQIQEAISRIDALKMREQAKGNIISTSEPIETSVTDTLGPKINVPHLLNT